jgi:hypothetical protein
MRKFLIPLALIAAVATTPAFAAVSHKYVMKPHASKQTVCVIKGKKQACPVQAKHQLKKLHVAAKKH